MSSAVKMYSALVFLWVTFCAMQASGAGAERPSFLGCTSTSECAEDECCMLGMERYSIPTCTKLRGPGEPCRPHNAPSSTTVYYPGGTQAQLTDIYYSLCNCSADLVCSRSSGTCETRRNIYY